MEYIKLNNQSSIICPYCGEIVRKNDLLFAGQSLHVLTDPVLSRFYLNFLDDIPDDITARKLYTWRNMPPDKIALEGDMVTGIFEEDGSLLSERVCYICHNAIPNIFLGSRYTAVMGEDKLINRWSEDMDHMENIGKMKLCSDQITFHSIYDHMMVAVHKEAESVFQEGRETLFRQNSENFLILLQLEDPVPGEICMDRTTVESLNSLLDALFHIHMLYKPVLFLLYTDTPGTDDEQKEIHSALLNYIEKICQEKWNVCFWNGDGRSSAYKNCVKELYEN